MLCLAVLPLKRAACHTYSRSRGHDKGRDGVCVFEAVCPYGCVYFRHTASSFLPVEPPSPPQHSSPVPGPPLISLSDTPACKHACYHTQGCVTFTLTRTQWISVSFDKHAVTQICSHVSQCISSPTRTIKALSHISNPLIVIVRMIVLSVFAGYRFVCLCSCSYVFIYALGKKRERTEWGFTVGWWEAVRYKPISCIDFPGNEFPEWRRTQRC